MNWLLKLSQKPMALPVTPPVREREANDGIDAIDQSMSEETSNLLRLKFPNIGYGGAGSFGVVFKTGPNEMAKITESWEEVENINIVIYDKIDWVVPFLGEPEQIQEEPPLWLIRMKQLKPLKPNEQMLVTYLTHQSRIPHIDFVMEDYVAYLDVDNILKIYTQIKYIMEQNIHFTDLHGGNFGWDSDDGKLKLFDLGI